MLKNLSKPGSLADVDERFSERQYSTGSEEASTQALLGWSDRRFTALLTGQRRGKTTGRLTARVLLRIDDACG